MLPLLLVVTASRPTAAPFRREIGTAGFKAYYVETLASALAVLAQWRFDAILVHGEGFADAVVAMLAALRSASGAPILALVPDADEERQLGALEAGATQALAEPASARVVVAQLRRLVDVARPQSRPEPSPVRFGTLRLDPRGAAASVGAAPVALTQGEFEVLLLLASRPDELVHRQAIARTLGSASSEARRSADMHVCRIRRKLKDAGGHDLQLETVYGRGYLLRLRGVAADAERALPAEWSV